MAKNKIEVKVHQKQIKIKQFEYKATNRIVYRHYLNDVVSKIYVYEDDLEIAQEKMDSLGLKYTISYKKENKETSDE